MAGTTDTVPARLTPGEFVIKRESAEMLGLPLLEQLNSVSNGAAHDNIDALIGEATLSQMQPIVGGGMVGNENIAGYQDGGKVKFDKYKSKPSLGGFISNLISKISGEPTFDEMINLALLNDALKPESDNMPMPLKEKDEMESRHFNPMSITYREDTNNPNKIYITDEKRIYEPDKNPVNEYVFEPVETLENQPRLEGYQDGGAVSDATATSAMDELLAQAMLAESAQGQSQYSMLDADRVDAEENALMDMITSMAIPGTGVAGTTRGILEQLGKRSLKDVVKKEVVKRPVEHLSKIAGLKPFKQKQSVLDKIASTMKVAPGRKIKQTPRDWLLSPASKKLNWKGYEVLENTLHKPFDKIDLINPGYLQRYINRLVKVKKPSQLKKVASGVGTKRELGNYKTSDVKRYDVVDALYKKGFLNENDLKRISLSYKKKDRRKAMENLLKQESSSLFPGTVKGYQDGGKAEKSPNPFVPFKYRDKGAAASGKWGEFGDYQRALDEPDSAEVADKTRILRFLLDEFIAKEAYKDSVKNEMNNESMIDSILNMHPGAEYIGSPTGGEYKNTPEQDRWLNKHKDFLINPTYSPR